MSQFFEDPDDQIQVVIENDSKLQKDEDFEKVLVNVKNNSPLSTASLVSKLEFLNDYLNLVFQGVGEKMTDSSSNHLEKQATKSLNFMDLRLNAILKTSYAFQATFAK